MLKISKSKMLFLILLSIIIISCEITNDLKDNKKNTIGYNQDNFVPDSLEITATLTIYKSNSYNSFLDTVITITGYDAAFYNGSGYSVNAGIVTLNNDTILRYSTPTGQQNPDSMYAYGSQSYPLLSFNGSNYCWVVNGNVNFSYFTRTISSPDHEMNITSPSNGSSISKGRDLTITWSTSGTPADTVKILIAGNNHALNKYVPDNGSCTITSNELSIFTTSETVSIYLALGNFEFVRVNNKYVLVSVLSTHQIYGYITN